MKIKAIILPANPKGVSEMYHNVSEKLGEVDTHINFFKNKGTVLWATPTGWKRMSYSLDQLQDVSKGYFYQSKPTEAITHVFDVEYVKFASDIPDKDMKYMPDFRKKDEYVQNDRSLGWLKIKNIRELNQPMKCSDLRLYRTDQYFKRSYTRRALLVNYVNFSTKNI